jgi:hypothetical protein
VEIRTVVCRNDGYYRRTQAVVKLIHSRSRYMSSSACAGLASARRLARTSGLPHLIS